MCLTTYVYPFESFVGKRTNIVYVKLTHNFDELRTLASKWNEKLNVPIHYEEFLQSFSDTYRWVFDTKLRNFQFRYLHRIIYCSQILYKWKIVDSPLCTLCKSEYETMEHLFFNCNIVKRFWNLLISWYEALTDTEITITLENVSFCNHEINILNTLIIIGKQFIFARKLIDREPNIHIFKDKVMDIVKIERKIALDTKRYKPFIKKWKILFPNVD